MAKREKIPQALKDRVLQLLEPQTLILDNGTTTTVKLTATDAVGKACEELSIPVRKAWKDHPQTYVHTWRLALKKGQETKAESSPLAGVIDPSTSVDSDDVQTKAA